MLESAAFSLAMSARATPQPRSASRVGGESDRGRPRGPYFRTSELVAQTSEGLSMGISFVLDIRARRRPSRARLRERRPRTHVPLTGYCSHVICSRMLGRVRCFPSK